MRNGGLAESRRVGWLIAGVLSVVTAGWGLLEPGIYVGLIAPATRPGALSQDVITRSASSETAAGLWCWHQ